MPVYESDLQLAKEHDSKRSGRIILKQLQLTNRAGGVCKTGSLEQQTGLPRNILDNITRFTH